MICVRTLMFCLHSRPDIAEPDLVIHALDFVNMHKIQLHYMNVNIFDNKDVKFFYGQVAYVPTPSFPYNTMCFIMAVHRSSAYSRPALPDIRIKKAGEPPCGKLLRPPVFRSARFLCFCTPPSEPCGGIRCLRTRLWKDSARLRQAVSPQSSCRQIHPAWQV
jgi:hypothetical protein